MAKRRKPAAERRRVVVNVKMTATEKRRLEAAAKRAGMGVSTWLRLQGLKGTEENSGK